MQLHSSIITTPAIIFNTSHLLFLCRPMYVRQLARKKIKLETSSSIDTSSSLASSTSSSSPSATSSLVLTASSRGGGGRSSLISSPATTKRSPARKDVGGGGPVLTHTPVGSALRLAKGIEGAGLGCGHGLRLHRKKYCCTYL